jgi:transcriptional regulator with XRE-family HTH domain
VDLSDVIRSRRRELGLSQGELAKAAGVSVRQMARYEAGEQQPVFSAAVALAEALGISLTQLAGKSTHGIDLTGDWWSGWQTFRDGKEFIAVQPAHITQDDDFLQIAATKRGLSDDDGGYLWRGELRLWDNELLMGWYAASDGAVRSKGTMYFVLHPHGGQAWGRWVGMSYDGMVITGWSALARTEDQARELVQDLIDSDGVAGGADS